MHLCMAEYYIPGKKRGVPLEETWEKFLKDSYELIRAQESGDGDADTYEKQRELGLDMIQQYYAEYGNDPHWDVISPEQRFRALIPSLLDPTVAVAENVGTLDLVVRDMNDGSIRLIDHKNVASIQYAHLAIDDQSGTYIALGTHVLRDLELIGPKEAIKGMEYNFLRKAKADVRPINADGMRTNKPQKKHYIETLASADTEFVDYAAAHSAYSKMTLTQLQAEAEKTGVYVFGEVSEKQPTRNLYRHWVPRTKAERNAQIKHIAADVQVMDLYRSGKLPITKNSTDRCPYDCDFFDLCEIAESDPKGEKEFISMAFSRRDPYFDHREGAENSKASVAADSRTKEAATNG